jgi:hypothetical protein
VNEGDEKTPRAEAQETEPTRPSPLPEGPAGPEEPGALGDPEHIGELPDAVFNALWTRVMNAWDDDKPHQLALTYALEHAMLPEIAGRYRKLFDDPVKGERAKKKIDGIVAAATQMLMATKTEPLPKTPWQWTASAAAFFFLVVAFLAYKILLRH